MSIDIMLSRVCACARDIIYRDICKFIYNGTRTVCPCVVRLKKVVCKIKKVNACLNIKFFESAYRRHFYFEAITASN